MLKILEKMNLKDFSSMRVSGGTAKSYIQINKFQEFEKFIEKYNNNFFGASAEIMCVGEGTNTIFINKNHNLILLKLNLKKIARVGDNDLIEVGAGVNWDTFVKRYISLGGVGVELLSIIPGTVGAAPVQNIGAYGEEVSNFIHHIKVYDLKDRKFKTLSNKDCEFEYRNSIFKKHKFKSFGRYIILSVIFKIKKLGNGKEMPIPEYKDIKNYFLNTKNIREAKDLWVNNHHYKEVEKKREVTVNSIRKAVIAVRSLKFPDYKEVPNCGSFFKNPTIPKVQFEFLQKKFAEIPKFETKNSSQIKIPIAYILEKIGLKNFNSDFKKGNFGIYKNHALIVISNGQGDVKEFCKFIKNIKVKVYKNTNIVIEEEVNLI